jgi:hypothetical protein
MVATQTGCPLGLAARAGAAAGIRGGVGMMAGRAAVGGARVGGVMTAGRAATLRSALSGTVGRLGARSTMFVSRDLSLWHGGRLVGRLTPSGEIVLENSTAGIYLAGRIRDGMLWEVDAAGSTTQAIGSVRGATISRGVWLRTEPSSGATALEILKPRIQVEIRRFQDNWFEVAVQGGARGWVPSSQLALSAVFGGAAIAGGEDSAVVEMTPESRANGPEFTDGATLTLRDGSVLIVDGLDRDSAGAMFSMPDGTRFYAGNGAIASVVPLDDSLADTRVAKRIELAGGRNVSTTRCYYDEGLLVIESPQQPTILASPSVVSESCGAKAPRRRR